MTKDQLTEERLLNTRNWALARPDMSGSAVIVGAIDELLKSRWALDAVEGEIRAITPDWGRALSILGQLK